MAVQKKLSPHTIGCYLKWLRLKASKEYRVASQEILRLHEQLREADNCLGAAHGVYRPYLEPNVPDSTDKQVAQQKYWAAHEAATKAQEAVTNKEAEACKRFDLIQWWDPDDISTTIDNADCVVSPSFSVVVVEPPQIKGWTGTPRSRKKCGARLNVKTLFWSHHASARRLIRRAG